MVGGLGCLSRLQERPEEVESFEEVEKEAKEERKKEESKTAASKEIAGELQPRIELEAPLSATAPGEIRLPTAGSSAAKTVWHRKKSLVFLVQSTPLPAARAKGRAMSLSVFTARPGSGCSRPGPLGGERLG